MKRREEEKGMWFQGQRLLGFWGQMEVGREVILADKHRETDWENITRPSL